MILPTSIPAHIHSESIAGHETAIKKLLESIDELAPRMGDVVINRQINQHLASYRILIQELKEMKGNE